jgi:hypothetical protein
MTKLNFPKSLILFTTFLFASSSNASYYGRFISGGFISKEIIRSETKNNDIRYNDVAILSQRLYVNFDKILETSNEFTVDIRDKNNFFDKLNSETLKLNSRNTLQLHQFFVHNTPKDEQPLAYSVGRFSIPDAGAVVTDGVDIGMIKNLYGYSTKFSFFYGLNPQLLDETSITFNKDSKVYGGYANLEEKSSDWTSHFFSTSALVRQVYKSELDRFYFFNNTSSQTSNGNFFSSILYYDIQPVMNIQNLWTSYTFLLPNKYKIRSTISTIDTLHYSRVQDVRETLASSRYHQASVAINTPSAYDSIFLESKMSLGLRTVDKKNMMELKFRAFFPKIYLDEISGSLNAAAKKNFVSNDLIFGGSFIHSNKQREISLSEDIQIQRKTGFPLNYASITDGSYTKFIDRSLYGILSIQNIIDKNVSIFSALFKITYRFGEGGQAPIRDGSPPMGQL